LRSVKRQKTNIVPYYNFMAINKIINH